MITTKLISLEAGVTVIEAVVSIVILSIVGIAITGNLFVALRTAKTTEINHIASSLAASKLEELSAIDPIDLGPAFSEVEEEVVWPDLNMSFTRETEVTINADSSRTAKVIVMSNHSALKSKVQFQSNFALWE